MNTLPFQLDITRPVLIVGNGEPASAKVRLLESLGATVQRWRQAPSESTIKRVEEANQHHATRVSLVIIAEQSEWTARILHWAREERLLINVVDAPAASDGFIPAIVARGAVKIGIGTGGVSPVLARLIRTRIEQVLPPQLDALATFAKRWQVRVRKALPDVSRRRRFWERLLTSVLADQIGELPDAAVDQLMLQRVKDAHVGLGQVSLVGSGPGDASLLTLRGLKRLQEADVVLYDQLVDPSVLALARRDAILEDVGKRRGHCPMPQEAICQRLVEWARSGHTVCRLKGGDPYIFGRGGEEALALSAAGVAVEVVPGVTAASAIAASQGIPLTHRGLARSVRFLTGHVAVRQSPVDWSAMLAQAETLVVYMGLSHAGTIARELLAVGAASATPVAFIQNGARQNARVWESCLADVAQAIPHIDLRDGPVLIMIGQVVTLRSRLQAPNAVHGDNALYWLNIA
jgi:uroporphyrin-III C-methyltransferase/precorrin-2 dehydrogenase/sirohydrochlorin ferrochelatase